MSVIPLRMHWCIALPLLLVAGLISCHDGGSSSSIFRPKPKFTITAALPGVRIPAGGSAYVQVTLSRLNGFKDAVDLTLTGVPAGIQGQARVAADATSVSLPLTVAAELAPQALDQSQIKGSSGSLLVAVPFRIEVLAPLPADSYSPQHVIAAGAAQVGTQTQNQAIVQEGSQAVEGSNGTTTHRSGFHPAGTPNK